MLDIFNNNIFATTSLTTAIQTLKYVPGYIGGLGLFTPDPIRTETLAVEKRGTTLNLIKTSPRGAPAQQRIRETRNVRNFSTTRLRAEVQVQASELQFLRAFGQEEALVAAADEIARRQGELMADLALTREYHMMGAINGIWLDSDGSVLYNYFTEFGIAQPAAINFQWATRTNIRQFIHENVQRPIIRALGGVVPTNVDILALCGDTFFDALMENPEYKDTYKSDPERAMLRETNVFGTIRAYGITWVNYRGTDDNSTVGIPTNGCRFIIRGVPNLFKVAYSPGEDFDNGFSVGQPVYSKLASDPKWNEWVALMVASYPLYMCTRPETIMRGVAE